MRWLLRAPWAPLSDLGREARQVNRRARGLIALMALVAAGVVLSVRASPLLHWSIVAVCLMVWLVAYCATSGLGTEIIRAWSRVGGLEGVRRHYHRRRTPR